MGGGLGPVGGRTLFSVRSRPGAGDDVADPEVVLLEERDELAELLVGHVDGQLRGLDEVHALELLFILTPGL